jgi:hypothetical protein
MMRAGLLLLAAVLSGCVVQETRPLPKVEATQAVREIPAEERLDVVVQLRSGNP